MTMGLRSPPGAPLPARGGCASSSSTTSPIGMPPLGASITATALPSTPSVHASRRTRVDLPDSARPLERDAAAGGHRPHPLEQRARRRVQAEHGPRRRLARRAGRQPRGAPQRARQLVDARPAGAHLRLARPRGDAFERQATIPGELVAPPSQRFDQRRAERVHLGAHGQRLPLEQLGRGVLRRQPLRRGPALVPGRGEPEIDERAAAVGADDHVRGLEVAVQEPRAVHDRELVAGGGDRLEPRRRPAAEHVLEARALDQLPEHVAPAAPQRPERQHARHAQALEPAQRDRLPHQGADLVLARVAREQLEREHTPAHPIANRPDLTAAPRAQAAERLVARRQLRHRDACTPIRVYRADRPRGSTYRSTTDRRERPWPEAWRPGASRRCASPRGRSRRSGRTRTP